MSWSKMTPRFLTVLLEAKVMPSRVRFWLDAIFLRFSGPSTITSGSCGGCLPGWALFNSSCYFFSYIESSTVKKNWHQSREDCGSRGSDLVVIDDQEEQKFISSNIQNMKTSGQWWENGFWIGITDIETENRWVWINNVTEVEQRYWMDGEPNNHGKEDCGVAVSSIFNPWKTRFDGHCNRHNLHWICETPLTS
uniref:C-type lectin domain-containing protein n=1 Tax=Neolamprologus brichardi TaxID=32507 RepID=A0A3Q4GQ12_NEOBR